LIVDRTFGPSLSPDDSGDRMLVAAFRDGADEAAFRRLYAAHTPRLFLWLVRLCGGREGDAEELLQETWVRAAERLPTFRWESRLSTWLFGIAWNAWRESARARGPSRVAEEPLREDSEIADRDAGAAERLDLEKILRQLPDGYREVLLLHDLEGYTHDEIAGMLGISAGTSKSQLSRAREWVRRRLVNVRQGREAMP
jgi:RNA polymerase sigma-70 factor (ECF subfamily)